MKFAIVEDDEFLSRLINMVLSEITSDIKIISNGWQAIDQLLEADFDLIVLDIMLPGLNGLEICKKLRSNGKKTPILFLTAKSEDDDKVFGLDIGADDYLTKPFSNKELLARAKALTRRYQQAQSANQQFDQAIAIKELVINPKKHTVELAGKEISLTAKEFELLYLFMANKGKIFTRSELLDRVWGENFSGQEHTVNSHINRLRLKIEIDISLPEYILTVWGVGYKFNS
jgi:DNA-binding response OmpR family regulator